MISKVTTILIAALLASTCLAGGPDQSEVHNIEAYIQKHGVKQFVSLTANYLAKNAPMQLDKFTTLDSVIAIDKAVLFKYTITGDFEKIFQEGGGFSDRGMSILKSHPNYDKYLQTAMWAFNARRNCSHDSWGIPLKYGAKISHAYEDQRGKTIFSHTVDYSDCKKNLNIEDIAKEILK